MARKKKAINYESAYFILLTKHEKISKEFSDYKKAIEKSLEYIYKIYRRKKISNKTLAKMTMKAIHFNILK